MLVFLNYVKLIRLHQPAGILLLFFPCLFSLSLIKKSNILDSLDYIILFFIGSIFMRSAACIINDICDFKFDRNVSRTKKRPLACGSITFLNALLFLFFLLILSIIILLQFNYLTILSGFFITFFVILYPLMKRFTFFPQVFLAIVINFGVIMMSLALNSNVSRETLLLYLATIFWTIIYDTIYAFQDVDDDILIGVKSTAVKFYNNPRIFILLNYVAMSIIFILIGYLLNLSIFYFIFMLSSLLYYSKLIKNIDYKSTKNCAKFFNYNIIFAIGVTISLILS